MDINNLIDQVKAQNWAIGHYAVFGSALMAYYKLREVPNIDVVVDGELWEKLLINSSPDNEGFIHIGLIKVSNWWFAPTRKDIVTMIKEAEIIDGVPYIKLEEVLSYKKALIDGKNKNDVALLEEFLDKSKVKNINLGFNTYKPVIDDFVKDVELKLKERVISMIVFGSVSRSQAKGDSDIDLFVFYDDKKISREDLNEEMVEVLVRLRFMNSYKNLQKQNIYPEIYPFLISKSNSEDLLWVFLDAMEDGILIKDHHEFGSDLINKTKAKIKSMGGRRIRFPNGGWCWSLFGNYSLVNKNIKF